MEKSGVPTVDAFEIMIKSLDFTRRVKIRHPLDIVKIYKNKEKYQWFLVELGLQYFISKSDEQLIAIAVYSALGYIIFVDPETTKFVFEDEKSVLDFYEKVLDALD